jgi:ribosome maturation factor RimP
VEAEALVRPLVEAEGLELVEVVFAGEGARRVLRVTVDRPGGIDIDALASLSRRVSHHLDAEGFEPGPYALEISSPGIERPLTRPDQFRRFVDARIRVKTTVSVAGSRSHTGTLREADDEGVTLAAEQGEVRIAHAEIASARTVADWDAELKRSNA